MDSAGIAATNFTLSVLVKLCSRAKRLNRAFEMVDEITSKYKFKANIHVYSNLIHACTTHHDLNRAFDVMERLLSERVRPDARTYSLLLRSCLTAGKSQDAAGLLRAATGLRGTHSRLMGYSANALQPQGGLPPALISEVLEGLAYSGDDALSLAILKDLRSKSNVKIDPKLQMRLTAMAMRQ